MVVNGAYGDALDWRSSAWAIREMRDVFISLGWSRSAEDLFNLWFNRETYVRKYYPELLNEAT
jgi:hypothetical protein